MKSITYTKKDIIRRSALKVNLSNEEMKIVFDSMIETMRDILMEQHSNIRIELRNFGVYEVKPAKAKLKARNPKTNKIIEVPPHRKISFKPGKNIKKEMMKEWKV
tara:strand:+ start:931 stop:1245 length:315 start_codon:yes stop_codon:yes gene_type:complete